MFINRLPIVLVSIPLGGYILNGAIQEQTNKGKSLIIATVTLVFFILIRLFTIKYSDVLSQYVNVDNIQFIFKYCISIPSMLLVAIFFESIENQLIKYTAGFIGSITLEIYLVHEYFCKEIASLIFDYWLFNAILSYIIAIPLAYLLKVISAKALSIFPTLN